MAALHFVILLCILAKCVLCEEDADKPQALPQIGLGNIPNHLFGGANLANTHGLNMNSAGLQLNTNGLHINNGALNLNQANLNQAGFNLNQGGHLLNHQPQYTGTNAGNLNFNQHPQQNVAFSGSYGGTYGNAYSGLSGTDLSSFLSTAVKNYNQQQAETGLDSTFTSQIKELGTPAIHNTVHNSNMGLVTHGSDLVQPQTFGNGNPHSNSYQMPSFPVNGANFVSQDVSQGSNLYNPQSISHQGLPPQFSQHQSAVSFSDVQSGQNAHIGSQSEFHPMHIGGINSPTTDLKSLFGTGLNQYGSEIQQVQSGHNAQIGSQSGFQPIHIEGTNSDLKSLFNQYGSNQYGYGSDGLPNNGFKSGSANFIEDGSHKYHQNTPDFGITENKKFQSTGFSGFKDTAIDPTSMIGNSYSFNNLHTASHGSYGQESVQNAFKFNPHGPQMFQSDNLGANGFVNERGHSFKPSYAFGSHQQQAFKTEDPKSISFKSTPGLNAYKTNDYKNDFPERTVNNYDVKSHISEDTKGFESSEFNPYESNDHYTKDFESLESGNSQFSSHQFDHDQHSNKEFDSYKGYPNKKHIYSDIEGYGQNTYKVNENNNQNTHENPDGNSNDENNLNMKKKEPGMVVHISVKNGDHHHTQSLRYP